MICLGKNISETNGLEMEFNWTSNWLILSRLNSDLRIEGVEYFFQLNLTIWALRQVWDRLIDMFLHQYKSAFQSLCPSVFCNQFVFRIPLGTGKYSDWLKIFSFLFLSSNNKKLSKIMKINECNYIFGVLNHWSLNPYLIPLIWVKSENINKYFLFLFSS